MEDNKITTQDVGTTTASKKEDSKVGKTFSQEEVDNIVSKRLNDAKVKNDEAIKTAVANALEEERRQAKLTEEEREKEAKSKREAELKAREEEITLRENRIKAQELMAEKNIPTNLVDFVVTLDEAKTKENIEKLAKTYNKSIEDGITDKLKGTPPKDFSNDNKDSDKPKYSGRIAF